MKLRLNIALGIFAALCALPAFALAPPVLVGALTIPGEATDLYVGATGANFNRLGGPFSDLFYDRCPSAESKVRQGREVWCGRFEEADKLKIVEPAVPGEKDHLQVVLTYPLAFHRQQRIVAEARRPSVRGVHGQRDAGASAAAPTRDPQMTDLLAVDADIGKRAIGQEKRHNLDLPLR